MLWLYTKMQTPTFVVRDRHFDVILKKITFGTLTLTTCYIWHVLHYLPKLTIFCRTFFSILMCQCVTFHCYLSSVQCFLLVVLGGHLLYLSFAEMLLLAFVLFLCVTLNGASVMSHVLSTYLTSHSWCWSLLIYNTSFITIQAMCNCFHLKNSHIICVSNFSR